MSAPTGSIYLISRAPISYDYQHTIDFKTPKEQQAFWGSLVKKRLENYTYIRRDRQCIQVGMSFDDLDGFNYLMYRSEEGSRLTYAFITDRRYVNPNMTEVYFTIDVVQTFMFDYEIKPSYIVQSHVDRWDAEHKPIYSRTEEGLNYGSEYVTESAFELVKTDGYSSGFYFIICKQHENDKVCTKIRGASCPYVIYLMPAQDARDVSVQKLQDITGMNADKTVFNGPGGVKFATISHFQDFMMESSFGNYVMQIVYFPYLPIDYYMDSDATGYAHTHINTTGENGVFQFAHMSLNNGENVCTLLKIVEVFPDKLIKKIGGMDVLKGLEELPNDEQWTAIKANPRTTERDRRFESKLLCYPYRYNIFTDWTNAPMIIKNEYLSGDRIDIMCSMGFSYNMPRRYWVANYRKDPIGRESGIAQPLPLEQPIISDSYENYMLNNKNQISANLANANVSARIAREQLEFNTTMAIVGSGANAINGVIGGAATGGVGGAITGGVSGALNVGVGGVNAIGNEFFQKQVINQNVNALIRNENARQQDISKLPDTWHNSNDCTFAIVDGTKALTLYRKKICCEFAEQVAQHWHMFGYIVKRLEVPNTRSRTRFNYIKTVGANIVGDIEHQYIQTLRGIYDNGITFWHYSEKDFHPMDYTYENIEVKLL